jgi:hypothetical protein
MTYRTRRIGTVLVFIVVAWAAVAGARWWWLHG